MRKVKDKKTALLLALIYTFLLGFMMIGIGGHAAEHGHSADHATQHASFVCTWMCAVSSFVHSADQISCQRLNSSFESSIAYATKRVSSNTSIFAFYIRLPPDVLLS